MDTRITIKEVAKYAGVGVGTVSRVLNDNKNVKPHIRQKVEEAIKNLGYQPDSVARSLRTKKSNTIAFFVPDISNNSFPGIAKGLHDVLEEYGYNLILYNTGASGIKEKLTDFFGTRKVDGAFLAINEEDNDSVSKILNELKIPLIILDRDVKEVVADFIYTDYYGGIKNAVEHLIGLGHKNIGFVTGSPKIRPFRESLRGFTDALKLNDIPLNSNLIMTGESTVELGQKMMRQLSSLVKHKKITALISGSYPILVGVLESIQKERIRIPEDLSLISFEDSDMARLMSPSITVIQRPLYDMGRKVGFSLLDRLSKQNEENYQPSSIIVPTELVIRSSTQKIKEINYEIKR